MARKVRRPHPALRWPSFVVLTGLSGMTLWAVSAIRLAEVPSKSMEATLQPGDLLVMRIDAFRHRLPARGEIVVFRDLKKDELLVKRVIGLPNENVFTLGGQVWIDGVELDEPYARDFYSSSQVRRVKLGANELWMMGDNRDDSSDSRDFGPITSDQLVGKAASIIFPAHRRRKLEVPKYD